MSGRALVLGPLLAIVAGCRPAADAREQRDFERMRVQQRYNTYGRSHFFANGAVLQAPPEHTLPHDVALASRDSTRPAWFFTGRIDTSFATTLPTPVDNALLANGGRQFAISCAPCHGAAGFGGGPIAPNLEQKRPPSLRTSVVAARAPGTIFSIITDGLGQMPAYGWQLSPTTRWAIVAYIRALTTQPLTADGLADSTRAMSLRRLDSLHAAGLPLRELLRQTERP